MPTNNNFNRGTHGDSSFMLDGLPSSSEKPLPLGMGYVTELDFIDFAELKSVAPETIEYLEASYTGARMADDVVAMQAFSNAIAALRCIEVLPDDSIDKYKTNNSMEVCDEMREN